MKKNAVLIAGIMFTAAGCATGGQGGMAGYTSGSSTASSSQLTENSGNTIRSSEVIDRGAYGEPVAPSQISTAGQYDPGSQSAFQPDSSVRGGSSEARGSRDLAAQSEDSSGQPINPAVQADSSIRGGSLQSRQAAAEERGYSYGSDYQPDQSSMSSGSSSSSKSMQADSSIRGGSNEARGLTRHQSRFHSPYPDAEPGYGSPDDLNVGGFTGGPGMAQSGSANSTWSEDQLNPYHTAGVLDSSTANKLSSAAPEPPAQSDLNSSKHLEKDISGNYNLNAQGSAPSSQSASSNSKALAEFKDWREPSKTNDVNSVAGPNSRDSISSSINSSTSTDIAHNPDSGAGLPEKSGLTGASDEAVGGPASTEVGSSKSDVKPQSQVGATTDYQSPLFKNSRAQGVGSAATGEFGVANSGNLNAESSTSNSSNSAQMSDSDLAQKVKTDLVKGSTGTVGVSRTEAKKIQVSAKDGVITLKGTVPSEKDKQLVEIRAMQFRGVKRVQNDLTVSAQATPASRDTGNGRDLENRTDSLQH